MLSPLTDMSPTPGPLCNVMFVLMTGQRLRQWRYVDPALGQFVVVAVILTVVYVLDFI